MKMQQKSAAIFLSAVLILATGASAMRRVGAASPSSFPILLEGTIVTMNAARETYPERPCARARRPHRCGVERRQSRRSGVDLSGVVRAALGPHRDIHRGSISTSTITRFTASCHCGSRHRRIGSLSSADRSVR